MLMKRNITIPNLYYVLCLCLCIIANANAHMNTLGIRERQRSFSMMKESKKIKQQQQQHIFHLRVNRIFSLFNGNRKQNLRPEKESFFPLKVSLRRTRRNKNNDIKSENVYILFSIMDLIHLYAFMLSKKKSLR